MNKEVLALINLQWLIYNKNQTKPNRIYLIYTDEENSALNYQKKVDML